MDNEDVYAVVHSLSQKSIKFSLRQLLLGFWPVILGHAMGRTTSYCYLHIS